LSSAIKSNSHTTGRPIPTYYPTAEKFEEGHNFDAQFVALPQSKVEPACSDNMVSRRILVEWQLIEELACDTCASGACQVSGTIRGRRDLACCNCASDTSDCGFLDDRDVPERVYPVRKSVEDVCGFDAPACFDKQGCALRICRACQASHSSGLQDKYVAC